MNAAVPTDFFIDHLAAVPVFGVLRGHEPDRAVQLAEMWWNAGVELVEVSLTHDPDLVALAAVCERAAELGRTAGAGTVCTAGQVRAAAEAGAAFAVAPSLDREAVEAARAIALPYLPGVTTPSETHAALAFGCLSLKLFPASLLTPDWIRALSAPFPDARFVSVGGITMTNALDFLAAGAIGVGIGSGFDAVVLPTLVTSLRRFITLRDSQQGLRFV